MIAILGKRLLGRLIDLAFMCWRRPTRSGTPETAQVIEVTLIPAVVEQLSELVAANGLSVTDNVNRALTVYEFLDRMMASGHDIILRTRRRWWQIFSPRYSYQKVVFQTAE